MIRVIALVVASMLSTTAAPAAQASDIPSDDTWENCIIDVTCVLPPDRIHPDMDDHKLLFWLAVVLLPGGYLLGPVLVLPGDSRPPLSGRVLRATLLWQLFPIATPVVFGAATGTLALVLPLLAAALIGLVVTYVYRDTSFGPATPLVNAGLLTGITALYVSSWLVPLAALLGLMCGSVGSTMSSLYLGPMSLLNVYNHGMWKQDAAAARVSPKPAAHKTPPVVPSPSAAAPVASSPDLQSEVATAFQASASEVRGCVQQQKQADATLAKGMLKIQFTITDEGRTSAVEVVTPAHEHAFVGRCVRAVVEDWHFSSALWTGRTLIVPIDLDTY